MDSKKFKEPRETKLPDLSDIFSEGIFAFVVFQTIEGEFHVRPIGGDWGSGIADAVHEIKNNYPGCKIKLFEQSYTANRRFFAPAGIGTDRLLY
ncbi:MAG: hypothetical protein FWG63_11555 [Defluviitaleaceae bacterium]|nr:hypothetical protein [Defluviitaleaceae bacterium]